MRPSLRWEHHREEADGAQSASQYKKKKVVRHGQSINLGQFHRIYQDKPQYPRCFAALAIYSPAGIVVHTGDFKVDYTPVYGDAIDLQRFAEIGKKGVLALMSGQYQCGETGIYPV